jgi:hypothetical protein
MSRSAKETFTLGAASTTIEAAEALAGARAAAATMEKMSERAVISSSFLRGRCGRGLKRLAGCFSVCR